MSQPVFSRWLRLKHLLIFQIKLAFDALRDLFLSPVSFVCALADIIKNNPEDGGYFARLMAFGRQTDVWLNLFGQHQASPAVEKNYEASIETSAKAIATDKLPGGLTETNVDQLFDKIEALVKEQHANGALSRQAKTKLTQYINTLAGSKRQTPVEPLEHNQNNHPVE